MARHDYTLTTLQARTAMALVNASVTPENRHEIENTGKEIVNKLMKDFPEYFPTDIYSVLLAFVLAKLGKKSVDEKTISIMDFLALYADLKREHSETMNDYGAFGDLLEVIVRCMFIGNMNLVKSSHLFVKAIGKIDMMSSKFGKVEIGHNGKSWSNGTLYDYMAGEFESVVYGMFNNADKEKVYNACIDHNFAKVFSIVGKRMCYWSNKYDYLKDIDSVSKGKGITVKSGAIMNQYNESKYYAFLSAIEEKHFITLNELLNR